MKASDTVMDDKWIKIHTDFMSQPHGHIAVLRNVAKAQAEISFKAGIKEVVDWIENNGFKVDGRPILIPNDVIGMTCVFISDEKLKEWGVK